MDNVNIFKGGLKQTVSRQAFERLYEPSGWSIDDTAKPQLDELQETVKKLRGNESEVINFLAMKKRQPKRFDDKLFKSEMQE